MKSVFRSISIGQKKVTFGKIARNILIHTQLRVTFLKPNFVTFKTKSLLYNMSKSAEQLRATTYTSEAVMGADFYQWAHNTHLELHGLLFHVPNEIPRAKGETKTDHMRRIMHIKAQGLVSGIPDYVFIGNPLKNKPAIAIELKLANGVVGNEQKDIHKRYTEAGIPVYIVRTFTEWERVIRGCVE